MTCRQTVAALVVLVAAPGAGRAADAALDARKEPRLALAFEHDTLYRMDRGYDLFTRAESDSADGLSLSYDLLRLGPRTTVAVGVGWNGEELVNDWGAANHAALDVDTFQAAVTLRYALLWWLEPQVRLAAGLSLASVELDVDGSASRLEGDAWSAMGSAGAGVRVRTRTVRVGPLPVRASLAAEGGMAAGTPLSVKLEPRPPRDEAAAADRIPTEGVDLGTLGRVHPYVRFTFAVHF